jgi:lipoprotein-releasing system ATP-binding protein
LSSIINIKNLKKDYNTKKAVVHSLRGIDLSINESDTIAVVGESGAGKSTLLQILGTLEAPSSGEVIINGLNPFKDLTDKPARGIKNTKLFKFFSVINSERRLAKFRNDNIGFVFQFHHLLPEFTALENVMMPPLIRGTGKAEARDMAEDVLCSVGLKDRITHRPTELSGGEQQRVAIARAIVLNPKILLADEPSGNLDTKTSDKIHDILMDLNEQKKITMIIVTHNANFARGMKRTITLVDGKIV